MGSGFKDWIYWHFFTITANCGTCDQILLSQIRDFPFFVASYDSQGYGGGIRPRLHAGTRELVLTIRCLAMDYSIVPKTCFIETFDAKLPKFCTCLC
jgi:hypothetical protein